MPKIQREPLKTKTKETKTMANAVPVTGVVKEQPSANPNKIPAGGVPVDAKNVDANFKAKGQPKVSKTTNGNKRVDR